MSCWWCCGSDEDEEVDDDDDDDVDEDDEVDEDEDVELFDEVVLDGFKLTNPPPEEEFCCWCVDFVGSCDDLREAKNGLEKKQLRLGLNGFWVDSSIKLVFFLLFKSQVNY